MTNLPTVVKLPAVALFWVASTATAQGQPTGWPPPVLAPPIVALPAQPTAMLELTVGTDGMARTCRVVTSSGDPKGEELACRYFSRQGHNIRMGNDGLPVEYQKRFGVARSFLLQLEQAQR